jgi:hypothetical protein
MRHLRSTSFLIAATAIATTAVAQTPQFTVVPNTHTTTDAPSMLWLPGAGTPLRMQEIISANLLQGLVGKTITAMEFRRNAHANSFAGGAVDLALTLSISPNAPLDAATTFAANVGPAPSQVFVGQLQLPASPGTTTPSWTPANLLRIPFQTPFVYQGGNLCVDLLGTPVAGNNTNWWPADAVYSYATGTVVDLGGGCGSHGGPLHRWSFAEAKTIVPGGNAQFRAIGPQNSFGLVVFGTDDVAGWPLSIVLPLADLTCRMHVSAPLEVDVRLFLPNGQLNPSASYALPIPTSPNLTGASLTTQWVEWSQPASSNALQWTIGGIPDIEMVHVSAHATEAVGRKLVHIAHVLRFEHN